MQGLTDGISSRYLGANRSTLLPGLESMRSTKPADRSKALIGRLEELLVFEIRQDGGTEYHRFTVRTLHKYVLKAIRNTNDDVTNNQASPRNLTDQFALGRAILNQPLKTSPAPVEMNPIASAESSGNVDISATPVKEPSSVERQQPAGSTNPLAGRVGDEEKVSREPLTYRELLGGFLHPRDMRKLVTPFSASNEPELIVRRHAMLLNFDPLRAIILRDRLLVLVPDGADSILVQLEQMVLGNEGMNQEKIFDSNPSLAGIAEQEEKEKEEEEEEEEEIFFETVTDYPPSLQLGDLSHIQAGDPDFVLHMDDNIELHKTYEWAEMDNRNWIDLPFELQSADAILNAACVILADDVLDLQVLANKLISDLLDPGSDVGDHAQEMLRTMKNSVKEMMSRVKGFCRAVDATLDDFEDMALMNLTRLLTHPDRFIQPVPQSVLDEESDEPELILEAHLQRGHTLSNALSLVEGQINSTEDFAVRKSDSIRNRLLYINMMISLLSLTVAGASLIGSLFGMNVENPLEDSPTAFYLLTGATIGGSLIFMILTFCVIFRLGALPRLFN